MTCVMQGPHIKCVNVLTTLFLFIMDKEKHLKSMHLRNKIKQKNTERYTLYHINACCSQGIVFNFTMKFQH